VLEHVQPDPPLYPPHLKGVARVFAQWADTTLFWAAMAHNLQPKGAAHVFAKAPPEAVKAFAEDRKAMSSNRRIAEIAEAVVTAHDLLGPEQGGRE